MTIRVFDDYDLLFEEALNFHIEAIDKDHLNYLYIEGRRSTELPEWIIKEDNE